MKTVDLIRRAYLPTCTLGELVIDDLRLATIERPWRQNANDVSCVPEGVYDVVCHQRPKGERAYALVNPALQVYRYATDIPSGQPGRFLILIHLGNWVEDVVGCIAPGREAGITRSRHSRAWENAVLQSREAMDDLRAALEWPGDGITVARLHIRQVAGAHLFD